MRKQKKLALTAVSAFLAFGMFVPSASAACGGKNPQVKDAKGDATGFLVESTPGPNNPGLDILTGYLRYDAKKLTVGFYTTVADLQDTGPPPTLGMNWRFAFTFANNQFQVAALRSSISGDVYALGHLPAGGTSYGAIDRTLKGVFDSKKNIVRVDLPLKKFNTAAKTVGVKATMKMGSALTTFSATAQRYIGTGTASPGGGVPTGTTPTADVGPGVCAYIVGQA